MNFINTSLKLEINFSLTLVARREYIDDRQGNMTNGKLTAIDMTKPILIISLDKPCEKLVRTFPENILIQFNQIFTRII